MYNTQLCFNTNKYKHN